MEDITITIIQIAKIIKERTDANDHTQALIIASKLLDNLQKSGETIRTKVLKHIREIAYLKGYMPDALLEMREESRPWIMNGLRNALSVTFYNKINDAM